MNKSNGIHIKHIKWRSNEARMKFLGQTNRSAVIIVTGLEQLACLMAVKSLHLSHLPQPRNGVLLPLYLPGQWRKFIAALL